MGKTEAWKTEESATGFILGWEGCIAEDSLSFLDAFKAEKIMETEVNGKTYHTFTNKLKSVPTKLYASKLGDIALRYGRYKVRYHLIINILLIHNPLRTYIMPCF
jgi:hypothetical protein